MDLCSVEFYVERAKISGTFNHGAFWNKLNIYPGARWKKPTTTIKKKWKKTAEDFLWSVPWRNIIGNTKSSSTVNYLSVYWFIWDFFWYWKRKGFLLYYYFFPCLVFFPHCHKRFQTGLCLFWHGRALLSLTSPLGTNLCSLKTSECNKTCRNMQHRHAPQADSMLKICTVLSSCSYSMCSLHLGYFHLKWDL